MKYILKHWIFVFFLLMATIIPSHSGKHGEPSSVGQGGWNTPNTPFDIQLKNSTAIMYATLFSNKYEYFRLSDQEIALNEDKITFLKKVYLLLALIPLEYTPDNHSKDLKPWPFPLATALTQGQRVMFILSNVDLKEFMDFLTDKKEDLFFARQYSSHGVKCFSPPHIFCKEVKIKNPLKQLRSKGKNFGMNIALGGIGNSLHNENIIGPGGTEWSVKGGQFLEGRQLGHILIHEREFPDNIAVLMIGLEGSAPGYKNSVSSHNIFSGMMDQTRRNSATGGSKWALFETEPRPPAEYGGKVAIITLVAFEKYKKRIAEILALPLEVQADMFRKFLGEPSQMAQETVMPKNAMEEEIKETL